MGWGGGQLKLFSAIENFAESFAKTFPLSSDAKSSLQGALDALDLHGGLSGTSSSPAANFLKRVMATNGISHTNSLAVRNCLGARWSLIPPSWRHASPAAVPATSTLQHTPARTP